MSTWLTVTLWIAGAIVTLTAAGTAIYKLVVVPLRKAYQVLLGWLARIAAAADVGTALAFELRALSGAIVGLAAALFDDQQELRREHVQIAKRQEDTAELVVDLTADVERIKRRLDLEEQ